MLAPHWLDEVFLRPKKYLEVLVANPNFKMAIQKAEKAYLEAQEDMKVDAGFCGPGPEQAARVAFLEILNKPN